MPIIMQGGQDRDNKDFYPTPSGLASYTVDALFWNEYHDTLVHPDLKDLSTWAWDESRTLKVLDIGVGAGVWGYELHSRIPNLRLHGLDKFFKVAPAIYEQFHYGDLRTWDGGDNYDLVIGNPPYNMAEEAVWVANRVLKSGGYLVFLLRTAFICGQKRSSGLYKEWMPIAKWECPRRPSFTGNGKTDATDYAIFVWRKGYNHPYFRGSHIHWEYNEEDYWGTEEESKATAEAAIDAHLYPAKYPELDLPLDMRNFF